MSSRKSIQAGSPSTGGVTPPHPIKTIVETSIYAMNLDEMEAFYSGILNLRIVAREAGRHVFLMVGPGSLLLIFNSETTLHGHLFPSHGATGAGHVAFGVTSESIDSWRERLIANRIEIEKEHTWPKGGHSIYFRDPAGNSVELITPNVWGTRNGW